MAFAFWEPFEGFYVDLQKPKNYDEVVEKLGE